MRGGYFRLNGRRLFLRSTHTLNHYPIGQIVPPTPDFIRRDLLFAKTAGFNMVRFIGGMPLPEQLDYCDEIGLMVHEECRAGWCLLDSPNMAARYDANLREMIVRDRNHPSVTIWGLLNEAPEGPVFRRAVAFLPELRKLDDTRLVLLNSGRWDGDTSVGSLSNPGHGAWEYQWGMDAPGARAEPNASDCNNLRYVDHTGEVHLYPPAPHKLDIVNFIRTLARKTKPIYLSEFGMGSLFNVVEELKEYEQARAKPDLTDFAYFRAMREGLMADWQRFGMSQAYPFPEDMFRDSHAQCARQRRLGFDIIRSNPKLCGYNLTGMLDHVFAGEGVWSFWRNMKPGVLEAVRDGWSPLRWCLFVAPMHGHAGRPVTIEAVLASEDVLPAGQYPATFRIFGARGVVWERRKLVRLRPDADGELPLAVPVLKEELKLRLPAGRYTFAASLDRGGRAVGDRKDFDIADPARWPALKGRVVLWGVEPRVRKWLESRGLQCRQFDGRSRSAKEVVLVGDPTTTGKSQDELALLWKGLMAGVARGGVAVFMDSFAALKRELIGFLPEKIGRVRQNVDWLYHKECVACPHPVFEGLQAPGVLDWEYYDQVISSRYLEAGEAPDETALAAFAVGHNEPSSGYTSGVMIGVYGCGRGRLVLNTLNVLNLVDRHPAADRLLANFIRYAQTTAGAPTKAGLKRFAKGMWAADYKPDACSAFKRKWEISGACESPDDIADAMPPPDGLTWTPVAFNSDFVNFHQVHPGVGGLMYARGYVEAPEDCRTKVLLGSDGICKLWIDGRMVGTIEQAENPARKDRRQFPVDLAKGRHEVVVGLERRKGNSWGFYLRFMKADAVFSPEERATMRACLPVVDVRMKR